MWDTNSWKLLLEVMGIIREFMGYDWKIYETNGKLWGYRWEIRDGQWSMVEPEDRFFGARPLWQWRFCW